MTALRAVDEAKRPSNIELTEIDFYPSTEVEEVAKRLIEQHRFLFAHLSELKLIYLLRQVEGEIEEKTIDALAKAVKAPALWRDTFGVDAAIWVDRRWWVKFTEAEREAVVLHELLHVGVNDKGRAKMLDHDVEEFGMVVRLYGPWRPDVALFEQQLGLFESSKN
jgi:predicted metallopeptidase